MSTASRPPSEAACATVPFRFGGFDDPVVQRMARARAALPEAPDPRAWLAVGDADAVLDRVRAYVAAGVSKFVMIPLAEDEEDVLEQTRRLVAEVLPPAEVLAPAKSAAA